jgi:hypothetical protein
MARSSECMDSYPQNVLDAADIVRDAIFHQQIGGVPNEVIDDMIAAQTESRLEKPESQTHRERK